MSKEIENNDELKKVEDKDLLSFVAKLDNTIRQQEGNTKRLEGIESAILEGFERNESATRELIGVMKVLLSQLDSPLQTNIDYERMYPDDIKVSNLKDIKIPDEVKVKKPNWYKEPDLMPVVKAIGKQYNLSLEDIVYGNKSSATSQQATLIKGQKGYKIYLTDITIANYSSNGAVVDIVNGNTGWTIPAPINGSVGGATLHFSTPLPGQDNEGWYFRVTPATNIVYCSAVGFRKNI